MNSRMNSIRISSNVLECGAEQNAVQHSFSLLWIAFLLPFFFPGGLGEILVGGIPGNIVAHLLKVASITFYFFYCLLDVDKTFLSLPLWPVSLATLYGLSLSISELFHTADYLSIRFVVFFPSFVIMCWVLARKDLNKFVNSVTLLFGIYLCIELITIIWFYPYGMFNYHGYFWEDTLAGAKYWLGSKNQAFNYMMLFVLCLSVRNILLEGKIGISPFFAAITSVFVAQFISSSATVICLLYMIVMLLLASSFPLNKSCMFNPYLLLIVIGLIFFMVCVFNIADNIPIIRDFLALFGRDASFTNRTLIWRIRIDSFMQSPIIGSGNDSFAVLNSVQNQSHNAFLEIASGYGLIAILPLLGLLVYMASVISEIKQTGSMYAILSLSVFVLLVHSCFDALDDFILLFVFALTHILCECSSKVNGMNYANHQN